MTVSLSKGQKVSLTKAGGGTLTRVRMGLGWDAAPKKGLFGMRKQTIDLDASCLLFNARGELVDQVWFRQLKSRDGAVQHTGDNLTGVGDGDDESIKVDLSRLSPEVQTLIFTVNSFTGQDFSQIENAFCRLIDESTEREVARYDLTGSGRHTAQVMAKVAREQQTWLMTAIGAAASGRTFRDLLPAIAAHL
ncbi:TerD family protein [Micromonospora sp. R77]|uniref:TerD family protein n=1 Tax=Micromonospora sp. R77 TaxID=2925836 RepID=UPI001F6053EB|nr:TerD family protein [Micromonospora sp. R77]MCI4066020.1 TerD family protein [Micromonospora sp. R77]